MISLRTIVWLIGVSQWILGWLAGLLVENLEVRGTLIWTISHYFVVHLRKSWDLIVWLTLFSVEWPWDFHFVIWKVSFVVFNGFRTHVYLVVCSLNQNIMLILPSTKYRLKLFSDFGIQCILKQLSHWRLNWFINYGTPSSYPFTYLFIIWNRWLHNWRFRLLKFLRNCLLQLLMLLYELWQVPV